jgi:hypothetical protein
MTRLALPLALAALTAALALPAHAEEHGATRDVRDWLAACDNVRTCRALSLPGDGDDAWFLRLDRDGGPAAPVRLMIMTKGEQSPRDGLLTLSAGGVALATLSLGAGLTHVDRGYVVDDQAAIAAVIGAARRAASLELRIQPTTPGGRTAAISATMSLDGASATLLWIDERQQRLGTVTALVRRGDRPADAVPAPPALPEAPPALTGLAAPPSAISAEVISEMARQAASYCEPDEQIEDSDAKRVFRLSEKLLLASTSCYSGAYNFSRAYFLIDEGPNPNVRPALFPRPAEDSSGSPANVLVNGDADETSGGVSFYDKGRGLFDCGSLGAWQWDGQAFRPTRFGTMPTCRGIDVDHWPKVFRTRGEE